MSREAGQILGHYQLLDLIGQGGMGNVYRAKDRRTGQIVAVKRLKAEPRPGESHFLDRFVQEGELLRQLEHPNIVKMLDAFVDKNEHVIVMEYVEGGSLRQKMDEAGRLPLAETISLALDLADALTRVHRLTIIHRDLKPENVLLTAGGAARLTDFGIAHLRGMQGMTQSGTVIGTTHYLSPEALNGQPVDERADIWSLGVILFEMLTGRHPFRKETLSATIMAVLMKTPRDLEALRPDLPPALVDLIYRMLYKERRARIASIRLVGAELEALAREQALSVVPATDSSPAITPAPASSLFATPTTPPDTPQHNLPLQTTPFVGREVELARLKQLFLDGRHRLVTIIGPGGMGKTRLALALAENLTYYFPHGVYFVPLAPLAGATAVSPTAPAAAAGADLQSSGPDTIVPAIAAAIGFQFSEQGDPQQQLLSFLQHKQMLLVLDNFEHLLAGSALLDQLLSASADLHLLVTSRERLNLSSETLFALSGMDLPDGSATHEALNHGAVQLFVESARRVRPDFELNPADLDHVVRLCRFIGGLPLAIILSATWVEMLTVAEIATELAGDLDLLETEMRDIPERHRRIRVVLQTTWERLDADEQTLFMGLSIFRGGFDRQAAQQVTGASLRVLMNLSYKSLLWREPASGRYDIHPLMRQFAAEKLAQKPELAARLRRLHSDHYLAFISRRAKALHGLSPKAVRNEIRCEIDNIRTAWQLAVARGDLALLEDSLPGLAQFYLLTGRYQEGVDLFQQALSQLANLAAGLDPQIQDRSRLALLLALAELSAHWGRLTFARDRLDEVIPLARQLADGPSEGQGRLILGYILSQQGQSSEARDLLAQALELARQSQTSALEAATLRYMGNVLADLGEYKQAITCLQQALAIQRQLGNRTGEQAVVLYLGVMAIEMGEYEQGRDYLRAALDLIQEVGSRALEARIQNATGFVHAALGDLDGALPFHRRSREISQRIGETVQESHALHNLCTVQRKLGQLDEAVAHGRESLRLAQGKRLSNAASYAWLHLGYALTEQGRLAEAAESLRQAGRLFEEQQRVTLFTEARVALAAVYLHQDDAGQALAEVEPVLPTVEAHTLDGTDEPFQIYLTCCQILLANEDPRADSLLSAAYEQLQRRAGRIADPVLRQKFLNDVPAHRRLAALRET